MTDAPGPLIVPRELAGRSWSGARSGVQDALEPASDGIRIAWIAIWIVVLGAMIYGAVRGFKART